MAKDVCFSLVVLELVGSRFWTLIVQVWRKGGGGLSDVMREELLI